MTRRPPVRLALLLALLAVVPVQAAISVVEALVETTTNNAATYISAGAFAPGANTVTVCHTGNTDADAAEDPTGMTWTTGGESWTKIATTAATSTSARLTSWRYTGSHASSTLTLVVHASDNQTSALFRCYTFTGANTTTPVLQSAGAAVDNSLTVSVTMTSSRSTGSVLLATAMTETESASDCVFAAESGYTLGTITDHSAPHTQSNSQYDNGSSDTTPTFTLSACGALTDSVIRAVEIACDGCSGGEPPPATGGGQRGLLLMGVGERR